MSQSDAHRMLVIRVAKAIQSRYPRIWLTTDLQRAPGNPVPPLIGGYRPDVYARRHSTKFFVIAEAKTDRDLDNKHSHRQISSFINFLEQQDNGLFVLSVTGHGANRAKTLLRFMRRVLQVKNAEIAVFDGCDFWLLTSPGGESWHLS